MSEVALSNCFSLDDGRGATVRPLQSTDVDRLARFFLGLSAHTRRLYGPHLFDRPTAERLCASAGGSRTIRFVAILDDPTCDEMIGYMILTREIWGDDRARYAADLGIGATAAFAPVVADDYQGRGIGTEIARHVMRCARDMGLARVILMGGVVVENRRARRLYEKLGFRRVREFWTHGRETLLNYDMVLDLAPETPAENDNPDQQA